MPMKHDKICQWNMMKYANETWWNMLMKHDEICQWNMMKYANETWWNMPMKHDKICQWNMIKSNLRQHPPGSYESLPWRRCLTAGASQT
jgi:hypothetical protein